MKTRILKVSLFTFLFMLGACNLAVGKLDVSDTGVINPNPNPGDGSGDGGGDGGGGGDNPLVSSVTNIDYGAGFTNITIYITNKDSAGAVVSTDRVVSNVTEPIVITATTNTNLSAVPPVQTISNTFALGNPVFDTIKTNFQLVIDGGGTGGGDNPLVSSVTNIDYGAGFTNITIYITNKNSAGAVVSTDRVVSNVTVPISIKATTNTNFQVTPPVSTISNTFALGNPVFDTIRTNFQVTVVDDRITTTAVSNIAYGAGFTNIIIYITNKNGGGNITTTDRVESNVIESITISASTNISTKTVPPIAIISNNFFLGNPVFNTIRTNFEVILDGSNPDFPILAAAESLTVSLDTSAFARAGAYEVRLRWKSVGESTNFSVFRVGNGTTVHVTNVQQASPGNVDVAVEKTSSIPSLGAYTYQVIATNFKQTRMGATNSVAFGNYTPSPPSVTSVTTNLAYLVTNVTTVNEPLNVYKRSSVSYTNTQFVGTTYQRWSITYTNKGNIDIMIRKGNSAENFTGYRIYRTSNPNSPSDLNGDNPNGWVNNIAKRVLYFSLNTPLNASFTDNVTNGTSFNDRKGSGTPTTYPKFYYRVVAVNVVNGVEYQSLPSVISAGASAINPDDLWSAPAYLNVVFDYNNNASDGFGGFAPLVNPAPANNLPTATPRGLADFGQRTRGGTSNVGPKYPFWVAWAQPTFRGLIPYSLAKFWVRMGVSTSTNIRANVPSFIKDTAYDFDFSFQSNPDTSSTFHVATRSNPTINNIVEMGHDTDNMRFPIIRPYRNQLGTAAQDTSRAKRPVGIGFIVTTINTAGITDSTGKPLEGESIGFWYGQNRY
ncbi:MAG: hypothetical protein ACRCY4_04000 [Brevinema sp.]